MSYLDAEFTEHVALNISLPRLAEDVFPGDEMPFSPKLTANVDIQYSAELSGGTLIPRVQASFLNNQLSTPFPHKRAKVPSRTLIDVRLTYQSASWWRVEGFVSNLTDKTYIASHVQNSTRVLGGNNYGAPRQYGLKATFSFD